jgi:hypothetical protein
MSVRTGRATRSARPGGRPSARTTSPLRTTQFRMGFIMGACVGMSVALLIGALAFAMTRAPAPAAPAAGADIAGAAEPTRSAGGPAAAIDVDARHLGELQVLIEAQVSTPTSYDPITRAQVVAFVDMVSMPMSHRQGPIILAEVGGKPGVYQGMAKVAMTGEYDIQVEVRQPMPSRAHRRIIIDTVS